MATKKPHITTIVEQHIYDAFKAEAESQKRTMSNLAAFVIEEYLENKNKSSGDK